MHGVNKVHGLIAKQFQPNSSPSEACLSPSPWKTRHNWNRKLALISPCQECASRHNSSLFVSIVLVLFHLNFYEPLLLYPAFHLTSHGHLIKGDETNWRWKRGCALVAIMTHSTTSDWAGDLTQDKGGLSSTRSVPWALQGNCYVRSCGMALRWWRHVLPLLPVPHPAKRNKSPGLAQPLAVELHMAVRKLWLLFFLFFPHLTALEWLPKRCTP